MTLYARFLMLKSLYRHTTPLVWVWLVLSPAAQSAEQQTPPAEPAQPALAVPFDRYQNFRDEPVADWRKVNDRVNEIGGWRTYLREAYQDGNNAGQGRHQH
jgi:hypothetical protein